jgi:hypothetical protein
MIPQRPPIFPVPVPSSIITEDELKRFLQAKNIKGVCMECGANEWTSDGEDGSNLPVLPIQGGSPAIGASVPLLILICSNCGNTKIFDRTVILRWLERGPE